MIQTKNAEYTRWPVQCRSAVHETPTEDRVIIDVSSFVVAGEKPMLRPCRLLENAVKINEEHEFKGKNKYLKKNRGNLSRVNKYLNKIKEYIALPFQKLVLTKTEKFAVLTQSGKKISSELETLVKGAEKEMVEALSSSEASKRSGILFLGVFSIIAVLSGGVGWECI